MAYEDSDCNDCELHKKCRHRCLSSFGDLKTCKLAIYLDHPNIVEDRRGRSFVGQSADFVRFCLERMSVPLDQVYLDYIVKCYPSKLPGPKADRMACVAACSCYRFASLQDMPKLKALVALGSLGCETFTGSKSVGDRAGAEWKPLGHTMQSLVPHVWIGYSPGMLIEKPSEAGAIYRVIWRAAEEAGFSPQFNSKIKPYQFDI
jgi:uracil-DNA glycosylase family 4